jgi:DhnA family fructose-bisphosphate aldolase class Ia
LKVGRIDTVPKCIIKFNGRTETLSNDRLVDLQNETDVVKYLPDLYRETCLTSSQDANQVMIMKVEEVSGMQEKAVPVPIPWHAVNAECEVSCMSQLLSRFYKCMELAVNFLFSVFLSVCLHETKLL